MPDSALPNISTKQLALQNRVKIAVISNTDHHGNVNKDCNTVLLYFKP